MVHASTGISVHRPSPRAACGVPFQSVVPTHTTPGRPELSRTVMSSRSSGERPITVRLPSGSNRTRRAPALAHSTPSGPTTSGPDVIEASTVTHLLPSKRTSPSAVIATSHRRAPRCPRRCQTPARRRPTRHRRTGPAGTRPGPAPAGPGQDRGGAGLRRDGEPLIGGEDRQAPRASPRTTASSPASQTSAPSLTATEAGYHSPHPSCDTWTGSSYHRSHEDPSYRYSQSC